MAENMNKKSDVKKSEITSTVEDTCFVNIPEEEIKLENAEIQGKLIKRGKRDLFESISRISAMINYR